MSLHGRRGAMLQEPSRIKRINEYFALPAALQADSALSSIMSLGRGMFKSIGLKFLEVMTPKVELAVQTRETAEGDKEKPRAETRRKAKFEDKREELEMVLPVKRPLEGGKVDKLRKVVCRVHASAQTDLPYEPKPKGCINRLELNRKTEQTPPVTELAAEDDTKGSEEEEDEIGYKRVTHRKKVKVWIHRGPSLEVIPEVKSSKKPLHNIPTYTSTQRLLPEHSNSTNFPPKQCKSIPESKTETQAKGKNGGTIEIPAIAQPLFSIPSQSTKENPVQSLPQSSSPLFQFTSNQPYAASPGLFSSNPVPNQSSNPTQDSSQSINPLKFFQISPESRNKLEAEPGLETPKFEVRQNKETSQNFGLLSQKAKSERPAFVPASPPPAYLMKANQVKIEDSGPKIASFEESLKGFDDKSEISSGKRFAGLKGDFVDFVADVSGSGNKGGCEKESSQGGKESDLLSDGKTGSLIGERQKEKDKVEEVEKIQTTEVGMRQAAREESKGLESDAKPLYPIHSAPPTATPTEKASTIFATSAPSIPPTSTQTLTASPQAPSPVSSMPPRTVISDYQSNPFLNTSAFKPASDVSYRFGESRPAPAPSQLQSVLSMPPIQTTPQMHFRGSDIEMGAGSSQIPSNFGGFTSNQHNLPSNPQVFGGNMLAGGFNPNASTSASCMNSLNNLSSGQNMSPIVGTNSFGQMQAGYPDPGLGFAQPTNLPTFQASFNPLPFSQGAFAPSQPASFISSPSSYPSQASGNKAAGFSLGIISGNTNKRGRK